MLGDARSDSLVSNFAQQWLYLRNLATTAPSQADFPDWDNEFAGRIGGGYEWGSGSKVSASVWVLEAQQAASGNGPTGGSVHFAIGPPILTGGSFVGNEGSPGFYDVTTEIKATTFDVAWARTHDLSDDFSMEWSVGLRYAEFEETMVGVYDEDSSTGANFLQVRYDAAKSNQGEFIGARAGVRATHRALTRLSLTAGLGFSFLDGEYTASSSLTPSGVVNSLTVPGSLVSIVDDGRSGSIRDFDAAAIWHAVGDALQVSFGWERSSWEDVAADLVRNFPGTTSPLRERRSVSFSAYKVGVLFRL